MPAYMAKRTIYIGVAYKKTELLYSILYIIVTMMEMAIRGMMEESYTYYDNSSK